MEAQLQATLQLQQLLSPKQQKSVSNKILIARPVTGTDKAEIWIKAHPDCVTMTTREIAKHVGCHPMDVSRAKKRMSIK
jgi:protein subunit release factor A